MPNPRPVGNKTPRRGRKLRRDIHLGQEAAESLRALLANRRGNSPSITEDQIVEELINAAWQELDQEYEALAENWQGEVL